MSDRAEKLAAARRKLKEYQERGRSVSPANRNKHKSDDRVLTNHFVDQKQQNEPESIPPIEEIDIRLTKSPSEDAVKTALVTESVAGELPVILPDSNSSLTNGSSMQETDFDTFMPLSGKQGSRVPDVEQQLASQLETINFLVAERNDTQRTLQVCQQTCETLKREKEFFESKFSEAQKDVSHLQYNSSILQSQNSTLQLEANSCKSKCHQLTDEMSQAKEQNLALSNQVQQLQFSLQAKALECDNLQNRVNVFEANMLHESNADQVEALQKEKSQLSQEIEDYKERLSRLTVERDTLNQQYQQYIVRLNNQSRALTTQLEQVSKERKEMADKMVLLQSQCQEAHNTVTKLQDELKNCKSAPLPPQIITEIPIQALDQKTLQSDKETQQRKYNELLMDNDQLSKLVLEKEALVQELSLKVERLEAEESSQSRSQLLEEKEKLLVSLQSDKAAAARAVTQNRQLKLQLEELEKGFVVLSNNKLELTEKLESEQYAMKDLRIRFEDQLHTLENVRQQLEQHSQEPDGKQIEILQQELQEAQERMRALTQQNTELKRLLSERSVTSEHKCDHDHEHSPEHESDHDHSRHADSPEEVFRESKVPMVDHLALRAALQQLESRFQRAMDQVAALSDDNQRLEHLVQQLHSETETIGEYVSLYQTQRGLLNQRAQDLAKDSSVLKNNVVQLAHLLSVVLPNDNQTSQALKDLQQLTLQESTLEHLCEEHSSLQNTPSSTTGDSEEHHLLNVGPGSNPVMALTADKAAQRIVQLLSDLTSFNTVRSESAALQLAMPDFEPESAPLPETFHPCPVCSGRLLTV